MPAKNPLIACPACNGYGTTGDALQHYCAVCRGDGYAYQNEVEAYANSHDAPRHACPALHCAGLRRYRGLPR